MKIKNALVAGLAMIACTAMPSMSVFAANDYGIEYSGGEPLDASNMRIEPALIDGLSTLINKDNIKRITYSNSNKWENGYWKASNDCYPIKFFKINSDGLNTSGDLYVEIENEQYVSKITFKNVVLEDSSTQLGENEVFTIGVREQSGFIDAGYEIYSDAECQDRIIETKRQTRRQNTRLFVETNIKLSNRNKNEIIPANQLYFGITDIDAAQSFKILNPENLLTAESMIARSATALQPADSELRNRFVASGNYIYSEFSIEQDKDLLIQGGNDVFTRVEVDIEEDGLDVVFGFAEAATSGTEFYAKQFPVHYKSDENGKVTGITDEEIISDNNPTGSETKPNEDYEFVYWIVDKDVILEDGTKIKVGETMTPEQVKKVVVTEELTFTAIHKTKSVIPVPNTGASTEELNAEKVAMPIGIALTVIVIGLVISAIRREKSRVKF